MRRCSCPGQMRPCTRCIRRSGRRLINLITAKLTPRQLVYLSAASIPVFLLYTVIFNLYHVSERGIFGYSLSPAPPPPVWSSPAERALLVDSMARWHYSTGMCEGCSAYRYNRVISPKASLCAPMYDGKDPELLILVSTIHRHKRHRCLIRHTWGTYTHNNTGRVRLLFLFGKDPGKNLTEERELQMEGAASGDILQDDFNSTYRRGGEIQLIMGYSWVVEHCSNVKHILKVSDDTFVNIPKVLDLIATTNLSDTIWGQCYGDSYPSRDKKHKWYISPEDWPAKMYPKYCAGAYLGVTLPVIRKILMIAPYIAWRSGNDDVLVGMCAEKLGIPTKDIPGFHVWDRTNPCRMKNPKYALHFHGHPADLIRYFWYRRDCFEGGHSRRKKSKAISF